VSTLNRYLLIAYAQSFVSHLFRISNIKDKEIRAVYLFGSVARGDFDKDSDIDIFIDTDHEIKSVIDKSLKILVNSEEWKKFQLLGIDNEIKVMYGKLSEWQLKESVHNDGIVLYSQSFSAGLTSYFLITIKPINDIAKRNKVIRKLFGRKEKYYKEKSLVVENGGTIIDSRSFIIPSEKVNEILRIFSKEKVVYKMEKIWK